MSVHFQSDDHTWSTPQILYDTLDKTWGFDWDAAALKGSSKCGTNYFGPDHRNSRLRDALTAHWSNRQSYWMNPPYGREIGKFMSRASTSRCDVVCLVPARTDTKWWYHSVHLRAHEIYFIHGRLKFGDSKNSAPFPSAVIVYYPVPQDYTGPLYGMMTVTGEILETCASQEEILRELR